MTAPRELDEGRGRRRTATQRRRDARLRRGIRTLVAAAALLAAMLLSVTSAKAEEEKPPRAVIHFVDLGGIESWQADGNEAMRIEGRNRRWYRATFMGPCIGLRFADTIGFVTDSSGSLDRFSSILVEGERCFFRTFEAIEAPGKRGD